MKISQLKQPYKKMAQFYTNDDRKKQRGLDLVDAFEWGYCVNSKYTKSHKNFWLSVDLGESPKIPKAILDHFNKHNPKQAFTVMGLPKDFSKETEKVAPVNKLKSTESYDHLLDKKMKGFDFNLEFVPGRPSLPYVKAMDKYIGKIGTITAVFGDIVEVKFDNMTWMYPSYLAKDHIVEDLIVEDLVGRKISAFAFKSGTNGIVYNSLVNDVLGYDGTIIAAYPDAIHVSFETRKGTITIKYPFGKDVKSDLTSRSAESFLIPEEEVQKALGNMPKEPFKVGETVYLSGNGGQYKCVIDRIYFCGNYPISLDAGKRTVLQNKTIDGRSQPGGDIVLSRTPWCDAYGAPLDILNVEPETITEEVTIDCDLKSEEIEAGFSLLQTLETVHLFADILKGVHDFTGKITPADIDYHVSLIERNLSK